MTNDESDHRPRSTVIDALRRHRWIVLASVVLAAALAFGASQFQPELYEARTDLILRNPRDTGILDAGNQSIPNPTRYVRNEAGVMESSAVAAAAADLLDGHVSVQHILENVSATPSRDLDQVTVRAVGSSREEAAGIANAIAAAYGDLKLQEARDNAQQATAALREAVDRLRLEVASLDDSLAEDPENSVLRAERDSAVAQLSSASSRLDQIETSASLFGSGVDILEAASASSSGLVQPKPLRNAIAAAVLALLATAAFSWWRTERSPAASDPMDPAPILRAPLLGEIPIHEDVGAGSPIPTISNPLSAAAEAYEYVLSALSFAADESAAKMVVFTSAKPGDGKTVTAANLAIASVQENGRRTLLLDADERVRGLSSLSGEQELLGLTDLATDDDVDFDACIHTWRPDSKTLRLIPAGTPLSHTAGFFRSASFRKAMMIIRGEADLVLIDTPPVLSVAETIDIIAQADAVVLVVNADSPLRDLEDARARIAQTGKPLIGYVFNRAKGRTRHGYGYE